MKKVLLITVAIAFILSAVAYAADVYPVPGMKDTFRASYQVKAYEPYPAAKEDGKIGRLLGWVYGKEKTDANLKKIYVMKTTKITKKGGGEATLNDVKADGVVLVTYKVIASKKKGDEPDLEALEMELQ